MFEIELKSNELKTDVYLKLNKDENTPLYDEDLNEIEVVHLNALDFLDEPTDVEICDLVFFKNLKNCYLSNMYIKDEDLEILNSIKSLESLQLNNCSFSNNKKMNLNLLRLIVNKCKDIKFKIFDNMITLESVRIVNCDNVELSGISKLSNLKKLYLQNLELDQIDEVKELKELEYLKLNGSKIKNLINLNNNKLEVEHNEKNFLYD